jgi:predicted MPP superfamily phosphohydrolase
MEEVAFFFGSRYLPDLIVLVLVLIAQAAGLLLILRGPAAGAAPWVRRAILLCAAASVTAVMFGFLLRSSRVSGHFPSWWAGWGRGLAITWAVLSVLWATAYALSRALSHSMDRACGGDPADHSPARRNFLRLARTALFGVPAAALGYGVFVGRFQLALREQDIPIADLPPDLDGLRLVQLTDIHLSPFLSEQELERAVAMANETHAHVALVTGDLITSSNDPLDACLDQLSRLRADAGIFGCLGNHEVYTRSERYVTIRGARLGMRFLRRDAAALRFGLTTLNVAGVDYQRFSKPYLVGADRLVQHDAFNLLLSHNPDVFPVAARQGYQLTLAGHTHGGQVRVEILSQDINIARFYTPYVDGLYRAGASSIFVSRGIGTIGLPARFGAPPEVALLRLRRT